MISNDQVVAKYNPEQKEVEIFDPRGTEFKKSDLICLTDMLNELVDEMVRRGYVPETIVFSRSKAENAAAEIKH